MSRTRFCAGVEDEGVESGRDGRGEPRSFRSAGRRLPWCTPEMSASARPPHLHLIETSATSSRVINCAHVTCAHLAAARGLRVRAGGGARGADNGDKAGDAAGG